MICQNKRDYCCVIVKEYIICQTKIDYCFVILKEDTICQTKRGSIFENIHCMSYLIIQYDYRICMYGLNI